MGKLEELKQLAETATPGPWRFVEQGMRRIENSDTEAFVCEGAALESEDARFVAAANPAAILALIAEVESLRKELGRD